MGWIPLEDLKKNQSIQIPSLLSTLSLFLSKCIVTFALKMPTIIRLNVMDYMSRHFSFF